MKPIPGKRSGYEPVARQIEDPTEESIVIIMLNGQSIKLSYQYTRRSMYLSTII